MANNYWFLTTLGMILLTVASVAHAAGLNVQAAGTAATAAQADMSLAESPSSVIKSTIERVLEKLAAEQEAIKNNPDHVYALVNEIVVPHLDIERMSRIVVGKHWRRASPGVSQRFVSEFQIMLVRTYGTSLREYANQEIHFFPPQKLSDKRRATVRIEIRPNGAPAIPLAFSMYQKNGAWKVYDLKIEGISLVANYRTQFSGVIRNKGLKGLVADMAARNQKMEVASR